jgi:photosystem II stability/assembly factor-like uncharacterized protein
MSDQNNSRPDSATCGAYTRFAGSGGSALKGLIAIGTLLAAMGNAACQPTSTGDLPTNTHVHGLAVDRVDPKYLLIATHHGLFRAAVSDGQAERVSVVQDFMGFNPHPNRAGILYASGHPAEGGNLGVITSNDGGKTWTEISPGLNGPVDFHQMTVSPLDANTIYGTYGDIQVSRDGGKSWQPAGAAPDKLIDLAASAKNSNTVYAATETGLLRSTDAAKTWTPILQGAPVTLVDISSDGTIHAFVFGMGLLRAPEQTLAWRKLSDDWGPRYILHLAVDPTDRERVYAATNDSQILASKDGGMNWTALGQ